MNTDLNIRLGQSYTRLIDRLGSENALAVSEFIELKLEDSYDELVTNKVFREESHLLRSEMHELRTEMHELRLELKGEMQEIRIKMESDKAEFRDEIHQLRKEMHKQNQFILGLFATTLLGIVGILITVILK